MQKLHEASCSRSTAAIAVLSETGSLHENKRTLHVLAPDDKDLSPCTASCSTLLYQNAANN